jgi:hypothetical protein
LIPDGQHAAPVIHPIAAKENPRSEWQGHDKTISGSILTSSPVQIATRAACPDALGCGQHPGRACDVQLQIQIAATLGPMSARDRIADFGKRKSTGLPF